MIISCYIDHCRSPFRKKDSTIRCTLVYPLSTDRELIVRINLLEVAGFKFRRSYSLNKKFTPNLFLKLAKAGEESYNKISHLASGFIDLRNMANVRFEIKTISRTEIQRSPDMSSRDLVYRRSIKYLPKTDIKIFQVSILNILDILSPFEHYNHDHDLLIDYFLSQ